MAKNGAPVVVLNPIQGSTKRADAVVALAVNKTISAVNEKGIFAQHIETLCMRYHSNGIPDPFTSARRKEAITMLHKGPGGPVSYVISFRLDETGQGGYVEFANCKDDGSSLFSHISSAFSTHPLFVCAGQVIAQADAGNKMAKARPLSWHGEQSKDKRVVFRDSLASLLEYVNKTITENLSHSMVDKAKEAAANLIKNYKSNKVQGSLSDALVQVLGSVSGGKLSLNGKLEEVRHEAYQAGQSSIHFIRVEESAYLPSLTVVLGEARNNAFKPVLESELGAQNFAMGVASFLTEKLQKLQ